MPRALKVEKRSGGIERFSSKKLEGSLERALGHKKVDVKLAKLIVREVKRRLAGRHKKMPVPTEEIKMTTYQVMLEMRLKRVAKYYLKYRYM